jgi:hypothetical protein
VATNPNRATSSPGRSEQPGQEYRAGNHRCFSTPLADRPTDDEAWLRCVRSSFVLRVTSSAPSAWATPDPDPLAQTRALGGPRSRNESSYPPPECRFQLQARCCATLRRVVARLTFHLAHSTKGHRPL